MTQSVIYRRAMNRRDCFENCRRCRDASFRAIGRAGAIRAGTVHGRRWIEALDAAPHLDDDHVVPASIATLCRWNTGATEFSGHGEGAPIVRYQEFPASAMKAVQAIANDITAGDPWKYRKYLADIRKALGEQQHAAMAAVDIAIFDWLGKKLDIPLYKFLGLDAADAPITDFSIGIDTPEITRQKTREAEDFPVLKVKVGLKTDEATIEAVRSVTRNPFAWMPTRDGPTRKRPSARSNWLETQGVEYVEQPMPAHMVEETRYVRGKVHLPIYADEHAPMSR